MRSARYPSAFRLLAAVAAVSLPYSTLGTIYTYVGPRSATDSAPSLNDLSNPTFWSTGTVPASDPSTQLVFNGSDADRYSVTNDAGSPFVAGNLTYNNWSTYAVLTQNPYTGTGAAPGSFNYLELSGSSPSISVNGPGAVSIGDLSSSSAGTFGTGSSEQIGLMLDPSSGTATVNGSGLGTISLGTDAGALISTGGIALHGNGYQNINFDSPTVYVVTQGLGNSYAHYPIYANSIAGAVDLYSGTLNLGDSTALGGAALNNGSGTSTAAVNVYGGQLVLANGTTFASNFNVAGQTNLVIIQGLNSTISGTIGGAGGIEVKNMNNGVSGAKPILSGMNTFIGPALVDAALGIGAAGGTLTISNGASISSSSGISVGNSSILGFSINGGTPALPVAAPVNLSGATVLITGDSSNDATTLGTLSLAGRNVFSFTAQGGSNPINFNAITLINHPTLLFQGGWAGTSPAAGGNGFITFTNGLGTFTDSAFNGTLPVVPFASGTSSTSSTAPNAFVTYNSTGVGLISITDASQVVQFGGPGTAGQFSNLPAGDSYVNFNVASASYNLSSPAQVYALSTSATTTITSGNSSPLNIASGTLVLGGALTLKGPNVTFTGGTGYVHVGTTLSVNGGSLNGSAGLVLSGASGTGVQFSDTSGNTDSSNPFTGGLTVNGLSLKYTNDLQLGASGGGITLNGGSLSFSNSSGGAVTLNRPITLGSAGGSISSTSSSITVSSQITGPGGLSIGSGVLDLTASNSYTGSTFLNGGTLNVLSDSNLGSDNSPLILNGGTLQFGAATTISKPITL